MSTGIRNTVIVLVYTGLESSCKDWKRKTGAGEDLAKKGLESSCKDWKQLSTPLDFPVLIPLRIFL